MTPPRRHYSLFPKTLSHCIEPLTRPLLKAQGLAGSRILTEWPSIVGPHLAKHSLPEKLSFPPGKKTDGLLCIAVESGFAPELQHKQPLILERLATYFGYRAVARIGISPGFLPAPKPTPKPPARAKIDYMPLAEGIADDELKAALQSLAQALSGAT